MSDKEVVKAVVFDLKKHNLTKEAEAGYEFPVVYPSTGEVIGFMTVRGAESKKAKAVSRKHATELEMKRSRKGKDYERSHAENEELLRDIAISRLIDIRDLTYNGEFMKFDPEDTSNVRELLTEQDWIVISILTESGNLLNFRPSED